MSQIGEGIAKSIKTKVKLVDCEWSSCKSKHEKKPPYPKNGKIPKGGYRDKWIAASMQPWDDTKTYGRGKKRLRADGSDYKTMTYEYKTQAHHLVPTTLLKKTTTLKHNLELIGYRSDCDENGMMLPEFKMDIPLHRVQAHLGKHPPGYMDPIKEELREIERDFDGICESDFFGVISLQKGVIVEINALSSTAKQKILNIRNPEKSFWPVRTNALSEYKEALAEYARREELHQIKQK